MSFSFVHITDHHLAEAEPSLINGFSPAHAFRAVMRHIARTVGSQVDFIVSTGDLVEHPSQAAYRALRQMLAVREEGPPAPGPLLTSLEGLNERPLYCLPGNHDDRDNFYECLFSKTSPGSLMNAVFLHQGIQFICLDWGPKSKAVAHPETLGFLGAALETGVPAILLMHHQLVPIGSRWLDSFIADDVDRFWRTVAGQSVLGIFCGHVHTTYDRVVHDIPVFGLRSTAFPFALQDEPLICLLPPHYRLVTVQNGVLTTRVFEVPL
jgi:3',5'-cyclic AMP phosphodiesterase CpdA